MILNYFFTLLSPLIGAGCLVVNSEDAKAPYFGKTYTNAMKGLACLIVIYVHMSHGFGNKLQDMIGSFAYVCVTFFFLVSAYGMMLSVERNENYLKNFWRNRLLSLLVPCFIINVCNCFFCTLKDGELTPILLIRINGYVKVLLHWCVWFYVVELIKKRFFPKRTDISDLLLVGGVVLSSLYLYFMVDAEVSAQAGWCFERMGLVWGVLLYRYFDKSVEWMKKHHTIKVAILFVFGGFLGVAYLKYKFVFFWGEYLLKIVLGFVLLLLLFTATSNIKIGCNPISQWLGNVSYEVYLCHGMVMGVLAYFLPHIQSGMFILLTVICALALSTIVHYIGNPVVKVLRK